METNIGRIFDAPIVKSIVNIGEFFFDASQVRGRARALLGTVSLVKETLATVEHLRRDCGEQLNHIDKQWIDVTIIPNAKMALERVSKLVESARVDMATKQGRVSWKAKTMFVITDGPQVIEAMTLLNTASTGLMTAMTLLRASQTPVFAQPIQGSPQSDEPPKSPHSTKSTSSGRSSPKSSYGEQGFLKWRRQSASDTKSSVSTTRAPSIALSFTDSPLIENISSALEPPPVDPVPPDTRPVYTGNDSFILLGDPWEPQKPQPPVVTINTPTAPYPTPPPPPPPPSVSLPPFTEFEASSLSRATRQSSFDKFKPLHEQISEPPQTTPQAPLLSQHVSHYNLTRHGSDTPRLPQQYELLQDPAPSHLRSASEVSLGTRSNESRGRAFMRRQAGIP